jgi:hypothetical protein
MTMTTTATTAPATARVVPLAEAVWRTRVAPTVRSLRRRVPAEALVGVDGAHLRLDVLDAGPCMLPLGRFVLDVTDRPA